MHTPTRLVFDVTLTDLVTGRHAYRCRVQADDPKHAAQKARVWASLAGIAESARLDAHIERLTPVELLAPALFVSEATADEFREVFADSLSGDLELQLTSHDHELARLREVLGRGNASHHGGQRV